MKHSARTSRNDAPSLSGSRQRGVALIFAMVILFVLTILGISALRTSLLEQLMTGNTQEMTRAFQAADSGISRAFNQMLPNADPTTFAATTYTYADMNASAQAEQPDRLQIASPQRDTQASGQDTLCHAYYNQRVFGQTALAISGSGLNHGVRAGAPANPSSAEGPCT